MKFYGNVTFVIQREDPEAPGNWKEYTIVKPYKGEWKRFISKWTPGSKINDDKRVMNTTGLFCTCMALIASLFCVPSESRIKNELDLPENID